MNPNEKLSEKALGVAKSQESWIVPIDPITHHTHFEVYRHFEDLAALMQVASETQKILLEERLIWLLNVYLLGGLQVLQGCESASRVFLNAGVSHWDVREPFSYTAVP